MTNRDQELIKIRPAIDFGEIPQPLAQFQEVLRQVLKFQNPILLKVSLHYLENKYKGFLKRDATVKTELLHQTLKKDIAFKKLLVGLMIGLFTEEETEFYFQNEQEINKRLIEFIFKRLSDQIIT